MRARCKQVLVRMTPDEHAAIDAAARDRGMTVTDFLIARGVASARDSMETERLEAALTDALEAARDGIAEDVKTALDAGNERTQKALKSLADWLQKRLGELGVSVPAAPSSAQKQE